MLFERMAIIGRRLAHPVVRSFADMPVAGPGRLDVKAIAKTLIHDLVAKYDLGKRAATDIAETNELNAYRIGH